MDNDNFLRTMIMFTFYRQQPHFMDNDNFLQTTIMFTFYRQQPHFTDNDYVLMFRFYIQRLHFRRLSQILEKFIDDTYMVIQVYLV